MDRQPAALRRRAAIAVGLFQWQLLWIASACCAQQAADAGAEDAQVIDAASSDTVTVATDPWVALVKNFRNDAALGDIYFVDRSSGWAVGDRGVVWHTDDGGVSWHQQASAVDCRLNSVFFLDSQHGWAAGGECRPYNNATRGVVLRTADGGKNWAPVPRLSLPLITRLKFFDANRGVAIGHATDYDPSGVFVTQDGGQTWQPLPADRAGGWLAGDFVDPATGAVAGPGGSFATLARRQIVHSPLATSSLHSFHAMRMLGATSGWLVGDGGVVLKTGDLGHSWQSPPADVPGSAVDHFDFHALAVHGESHVWAAGTPGTRVFHSHDGGQSWQAATTGHQAPIRAMHFVDPECGWAVGDLGNILATRDGGRTWQPQRSGARRAALLAIFANSDDVPLELIADAGAADGYITAVDILHVASETETTAQLGMREQTRSAMLLAGAAAAESAWRFPLPPDELAFAPADVLAALNRANDGRAIEQIEKRLVRGLRMWRPDVVVTHHRALEKSKPKAAVLVALILPSIAAAADSARHVELADEVGLPPWQVKKVYGLLPESSRGTESVLRGRFSPLLGTTLSDFVSPARHLLSADDTIPPDSYELELLMSQAADAGGRGGLFAGIAAAPEARRAQAELPVNDLTQVRRLAARRRHLEELLERTQGNAAWIAQVGNLIDELNPRDGAEMLVQLADGYRAAGRLDLAADTYYLLTRRFPDHPYVERALVWLVQFYASSETAHHVSAGRPSNVRPASLQEPDAMLPGMGLARDDRLRRAIQLSEYLKNVWPALYAEPSVRFAEAAAQRQLGFANPARRYNLTLEQLPRDNPWREAADTEEWLAQPADAPPPKNVGACRPAPERPHLDGTLDEPLWDTADRLRLRGDDVEQATLAVNKSDSVDKIAAELRLAYDAEYLYVAIHCPKVAGLDYRPDDEPRLRDSDLAQYDRVSVRLDIDRDFATAYELSVDSRGWTNDRCWGDLHWNPEWYVAAASDEWSWTVEAAVPWDSLVATRPGPRHAWAIAARRIVPRVGYQSWSGKPESDDSPAQFGLLLFE